MGSASAERNGFVRLRGGRTATNTFASRALRNRALALCGKTMKNVMIMPEVALR